MYTKENVNKWLNEAISLKQTVITILGITDNEMVIDSSWNAWVEVETRLAKLGVHCFGKSIPDIEKMLL